MSHKVKVDVSRPPNRPPAATPYFCKDHPVSLSILQQHLGRYIYVWLRGDQGFWMFPVALDCGYLEGFVWRGDHWLRRRIRWRQISSIY